MMGIEFIMGATLGVEFVPMNEEVKIPSGIIIHLFFVRIILAF
jgi:hypothetical protein